jgi:hypothetical protein
MAFAGVCEPGFVDSLRHEFESLGHLVDSTALDLPPRK